MEKTFRKNLPWLQIDYETYLDRILGGWIGKSIGGTIGARFEGNKGWIEIPAELFPPVVPPNDDLDLQVLWLKVLEERGSALTADDLAAAWLEGCWYPFNEYGIFRRNWKLGIRPPISGKFGNQFWETGMGCPIRAEIWGYVFPGAPDLAARYAAIDGGLDHTEQSVGAEKMFAAMASLAFFIPDVRRLTSLCIHHLPVGTPVERLTREAFRCHEEGVILRDARDRLMALAGNPEGCDAQTNVPFTFLALLYGGNDLEKTLHCALHCGYDTDCTMATAGALLGQILGASRIPAALSKKIGDELVMGIQYKRPEMTLSALARDTARIGVLLQSESGVEISNAPAVAPLPATAQSPAFSIVVDYQGLPAAAPADVVSIKVRIEGAVSTGLMRIEAPEGWTVAPTSIRVGPLRREVPVTLIAPAEPEAWPQKNIFTVALNDVRHEFGLSGAALWKFLGLYYDALPDPNDPVQVHRAMNHHFVSLKKNYIPEPVDVEGRFLDWSRKLGRPAVICSYENEIDLTQLVQITGPYCAYLAREVISPDDREVNALIGNNDAFRLYVNGKIAADIEESLPWTPHNNTLRIHLRKGKNQLLLKLLKRGDNLRYTFALRETASPHGYGAWANWQDWVIDLADGVPTLH